MKVFHTQECRTKELTFPKQCVRDDAWLGEAFYFWKEEIDADYWGNNSKRGTKYYEVYVCEIIASDYLDTVFNEEHYYFWIKQLEKIAKKIMSKTKQRPSLKELNDYITDKKVWPQVDYIQFQDLPTNTDQSFIKPIVYRSGKVRTVAFRN